MRFAGKKKEVEKQNNFFIFRFGHNSLSVKFEWFKLFATLELISNFPTQNLGRKKNEI